MRRLQRCVVSLKSLVVRIETLQTTPKLDTLIKPMQVLDLKHQVATVG